MSLEVLQSEIEKDTVDSTASDVRARNPGKWASDSAVPRFLYTSLATLASAYGSLSEMIIINVGTQLQARSSGIFIEQVEIDDTPEAMLDTDNFPDEQMTVKILVKLAQNSIASQGLWQYYLIRDIGLRLKYILDTRARSLPDNTFMLAHYPTTRDPDVSADPTIDPDSPYVMRLVYSGKPTATQQEHCLIAEFTRAFY